jgi:mono/diheme cytochrome c family protein
MNHLIRTTAIAALLGAVFSAPALAAGDATPDYQQVKAGRHQAVLADCMGCHTRPGGPLFGGGAPLETPFGSLTAPNITMDEDAGIGSWTKEEFRNAVKHGKGPHGELLYPAMPYVNYARMSDNDVDSIFDYLQTVEPVHVRGEGNHLRFPFNIRSLVAAWNWLYFKPGPAADTTKSAQWNRGAYLVNGPGHCDTCHTPKSALGGNSGAPLSGATLQGWFAPDITKDAQRGVGSWSVPDLVSYLKSGHNDHSMASGPMAEAIEDSTSLMDNADLTAIAVYLKDAPAASSTAPVMANKDDPHMKMGAAIYRDNCAACHGADGKGENHIFPPLQGNPIISQASTETLTRVVLAGTQSAGTETARTQPSMPGFAWRLNDAQIADVLTYVRGSFGGAGSVSSDSVQGIRGNLTRK